jgi:hypothetical protein
VAGRPALTMLGAVDPGPTCTDDGCLLPGPATGPEGATAH